MASCDSSPESDGGGEVVVGWLHVWGEYLLLIGDSSLG